MLCAVLCFNVYMVNKFHDNELAVAIAVTELFVISREAGSPLIVLAQCWRLKVSKNVLVSALQDLGLGLVSRQKSDISVSWNSRKVSVSVSSRTKNRMSRSRKLRSRLHPWHYLWKSDVGWFSCTLHIPATINWSFIGLKEGFFVGYV